MPVRAYAYTGLGHGRAIPAAVAGAVHACRLLAATGPKILPRFRWTSRGMNVSSRAAQRGPRAPRCLKPGNPPPDLLCPVCKRRPVRPERGPQRMDIADEAVSFRKDRDVHSA
jgi:hypothetical protein